MSSIAFTFPGQGAQYLGMGKSFFENFAIARETVKEAEEYLNRHILSMMLSGAAEELTATHNSQIAIYVVSVALQRVLQSLYPQIKPIVCAGLSLGEYSALTASGKLAFADGVQLVSQRGKWMSEACEKTAGTMAVALGLDAIVVKELIAKLQKVEGEQVWIANINCPGQVVISGTAASIAAASLALKEKGAKRILPLQVHGAFHSGLMEYAQKNLQNQIEEVPLHASPVDVVMNVSAQIATSEENLRTLLIQQVTHSVLWEASMHAMIKMGAKTFIEIGCGNTLTGFAKRIDPNLLAINIDSVDDLKTFETALGGI